MRWAFLISLGLNLAFAGLLVGAFLRGPPDRERPGWMLSGMARALPDGPRASLEQSVRERRGDWRALHEELRAQREVMAGALLRDPFRIEDVAQVLERGRLLNDGLAERGTALLLAQISELDADQRAEFAERLLERRSGPGKKR